METHLETLNGCKRKLQLIVSVDETKNDYMQTLYNYRKSISIPGFRKGRAPINIIENRYKDQIKADFISNYAFKYYIKAMKDLEKDKIYPLKEATLLDFQWNPGEKLKLIFSFEVPPVVKINNYKNFSIDFTPYKVTKQMINTELEHLKDQYTKNVEKEGKSENKDLIYYKIINFDKKDKGKNKDKEYTYQIGSKIFGKRFDDDVSGVKKGDILKTVIKNKSEKEDVQQSTFDVEIKINSVKKIIEPQLDNEFAQNVGDYKNMEELKNDIRSNIEKQLELKNQKLIEAKILDYLIKENPFTLPEANIESYVSEMLRGNQQNNKYIGEKELAKLKKQYRKYVENQMRIYYILEKLKEMLRVKVTEAEIEEEIKKSAESLNMDLDKYKKLYKKQINIEEIKNNLINKKILDIIKKTVRFKKKDYSKENNK